MLAIYKKELRGYFTSFLGYLFLSFLLIFVGIYQYVYNFRMEYANFAYAVSGISTFFLLLVPMLTMRVLAEEKRQKTDQLIFTAPVSVTRVILGKYLALISVFAVGMLIVCVYPLVLRNYGDTNLSIAYSTILAFFLLGCTYMAIGMFISSITESQVFAAVMTFVVILFTWLIDLVIEMLPTDHLTAYFVLLGCAAVIAVVLYLLMKSVLVSGLALLLGGGALTALLFAEPELLDGSLERVFGWISLLARFENFKYGIFEGSAYFYYLTLTFLFVFLTIQAIKKRRWE
ncbi:MAG: ABC transporter permease [Lachnospiraceae bacterium]|nr:ABC transporter permease [Lachnospiraceae bacterium]